jgi:hypothetical protein
MASRKTTTSAEDEAALDKALAKLTSETDDERRERIGLAKQCQDQRDAEDVKALAGRTPVTDGIPEGMYATTRIGTKYCPKCNSRGYAFATGIALCGKGHSWADCTDCDIIYGPVKGGWGGYECPLCHGARWRCKECNAKLGECTHPRPDDE